MSIRSNRVVGLLVRHARPVVASVLAAGVLTGCGGKILRENVLATTQSAVGITLAQNPQTQVYEFKAGYARNEFFLVPTSKRVVNDGCNKDAAGTKETKIQRGADGTITGSTSTYNTEAEHNDPTGTPEVLAEIQVGGSGKQTIGAGAEQGASLKVYQRLAVGKIAVQSGAAVALMSQDAQTARAVSSSSPFVTRSETYPILRNVLVALQQMQAAGDATADRHVQALGRLADSVLPAVAGFRNVTQTSVDANGSPDMTAMFYQLRPDIGSTSYPEVTKRDFGGLITYMDTLVESNKKTEQLLTVKSLEGTIQPPTTILVKGWVEGAPQRSQFRAPVATDIDALKKDLNRGKAHFEAMNTAITQSTAFDEALLYFFGMTKSEAK